MLLKNPTHKTLLARRDHTTTPLHLLLLLHLNYVQNNERKITTFRNPCGFMGRGQTSR